MSENKSSSWGKRNLIERWNFGPAPYERIIKRTMHPFKYDFVMELFNFSFKEAMDLKRKIDDEWFLLRNSGFVDFSIKESELKKNKLSSEMFYRTCQTFIDFKILTILDFLELVRTVEKAQTLHEQMNIPIQHLKETIWKIEDLLPYQKPLKASIDPENKSHLDCLDKLKELKITNNLSLLDAGRTMHGREKLISEVGITDDLLLELVHRADFLRGSHITAKTIEHFFKAGFDTVDKIRAKETHKIINDFRELKQSLGIQRKDKIIFGFVIYAKLTPRVFLN